MNDKMMDAVRCRFLRRDRTILGDESRWKNQSMNEPSEGKVRASIGLPKLAGHARSGVPVTLAVLLGGVCTALAESPDDVGSREAGPGHATAPLTDEVPDPPASFARWIDAGNVQFRFGGNPPPGRKDSAANLAAVTSFEIEYDYDARTRWRVRRGGDGRELVLTVALRDVSWTPRHVVWFRKRPPEEGFWEHQLVRHEFDHVRLSSDARLRRQFEDAIRARRVVRFQLSPADRVDDQFVQSRVAKLVREEFEDVTELIEIRYRELDRLTVQGVRPLPDDSSLQTTLEEANPNLTLERRRGR